MKQMVFPQNISRRIDTTTKTTEYEEHTKPIKNNLTDFVYTIILLRSILFEYHRHVYTLYNK
jgi:hypothetical protein